MGKIAEFHAIGVQRLFGDVKTAAQKVERDGLNQVVFQNGEDQYIAYNRDEKFCLNPLKAGDAVQVNGMSGVVMGVDKDYHVCNDNGAKFMIGFGAVFVIGSAFYLWRGKGPLNKAMGVAGVLLGTFIVGANIWHFYIKEHPKFGRMNKITETKPVE